jgi:ABC-type Na+ efflux pump permease subunit
MRAPMVRTLLRKEISSYRAQFVGDSKAALAFSTLTYAALSVASPLLIGFHWFEATALLLAYPVVASTFIIHSSLDTFAGERERHTLETLLASPILESEIVASKILGSMILTLSFGVIPLVIGIIALNIVGLASDPGTGLMLPAAHLLWGIPLLAITLPAAMCSVGLLVSLFAPSLRNAMQAYSFSLVGIMIVGSVGAVLLPVDITRSIDAWLAQHPVSGKFLFANGALTVVAAVAVLHLKAYFRRGARELL